MADTISSTNMLMPVPVVGVDPGPQFAIDLNGCFNILDIHDHSPGRGVPITPAGMSINADLSMGGNNLTNARSLRLTDQGSPLSDVSDLGCLYEVDGDLFFNDGSGNQVQITDNGGVAGTPGSISNLLPPASASYVAADDTFVWQSAANTSALMDAGSYIMRNDGTANSFGVTISAPLAMGADYSLVLPSLPASTKILTLDTSGNIVAQYSLDGATITAPANVLTVQPSALVDDVTTQVSGGKIATKHIYMSHQWQLNGIYSGLSVPNTEVDGYLFFPFDAEIIAIWIYNTAAGSGGTTEFDVKKSASSGSAFSTILSTTGKITSAAAADVWTDSNAVVASQTGVTKPVLTSANVSAGEALRFDVITVMSGSPTDCGILIQYVPRG